MSFWSERVLPFAIEKACRSGAILEERKHWVPRAHGRVLEIGVGSGLNLAFYDGAHVERVVGVEPSAALLAKARPRAAAAPVAVELVLSRAEDLAFDDASFDSAVVTYSLCSVDEPSRALEQIRRVLRPGAELFFVEHGRAPDAGPQRWQRRLTPAWSRVGGGCHLDRDVQAELLAAGFALEEVRAEYAEGPRWLSFTTQGLARRA